MNKDLLCLSACIFAISKLTDKGSYAFGTSTEFVNDDGSFEKRFVTIEWNEVVDWLTEIVENRQGDKQCEELKEN